jgi:Tfp pilus assembly protein PilE
MMRYHSQQGATLIIVLIFLLLITLLGAIAVRQSTTDLKVATADQVDTLLLNASDSANKRIEKIFESSDPTDKFATDTDYDNAVIKGTGMFGYYLSGVGQSNRDDQYIFCYNPRSSNFATFNNASVVKPDGGTVMSAGSGFCDVEKADSYSSARLTTLTQINVTRPSTAVAGQGNFKSVTQGSGIQAGEPGNESAVFNIYTTSILPNLSSVSAEKMNECLKQPIAPLDSAEQTLDACLKENGIPAKILVQQANVRNIVDSVVCYGFGVGNGKIQEDCQDLLEVDAQGKPKVSKAVP